MPTPYDRRESRERPSTKCLPVGEDGKRPAGEKRSCSTDDGVGAKQPLLFDHRSLYPTMEMFDDDGGDAEDDGTLCITEIFDRKLPAKKTSSTTMSRLLTSDHTADATVFESPFENSKAAPTVLLRVSSRPPMPPDESQSLPCQYHDSCSSLNTAVSFFEDDHDDDHAYQQQLPSRIPVVQIEVEPGVFLPLRGAAETIRAVNTGRAQLVDCMACGCLLSCVPDCEVVLCPECRFFSPAGDGSNHSSMPTIPNWMEEEEEEEGSNMRSVFCAHNHRARPRFRQQRRGVGLGLKMEY